MRLVMEELRNKRLIYSLEEIGFDCSMYAMNISSTIIRLAGCPDINDELMEWYMDLVDDAVKGLTVWNLKENIKNYASQICLKLQERIQALELTGLVEKKI